MRTDFDPITSIPVPASALRMAGLITMNTLEPKIFMTAEGGRFDDHQYSYNLYGINGNIAFRVSWVDASIWAAEKPRFGYIEADAPQAMANIDPVKTTGTLLVNVHPSREHNTAIQVNTKDGWSTIPGVNVYDMSPDFGELPPAGFFHNFRELFEFPLMEADTRAITWLNMETFSKFMLKSYKWDRLASKREDYTTCRFGWSTAKNASTNGGAFRLDYLPFSCGNLFPKVQVSFIGMPMEVADELAASISL